MQAGGYGSSATLSEEKVPRTLTDQWIRTAHDEPGGIFLKTQAEQWQTLTRRHIHLLRSPLPHTITREYTRLLSLLLLLFLPCRMGIPWSDPWSMTADWRSPHRPRRRKRPIRGKGWRLSQMTTSPSLHSAGQPEPRPRKPDTNKEPESPGAGRGNPEDRTLVSAG